jgi:DNA polymerase-1
MKNIIVDIEADGLLTDLTSVWCIAIKEVNGSTLSFSDYDDNLPDNAAAIPYMEAAERIIGHNFIRYDAPAIEKVMGYKIPNEKIYDTLIMSRLNQFNRIGKHSMKSWGENLGFPKGDYSDWSKYTPEMMTYCIQDVNVNETIYHKIVREANIIMEATSGRYQKAIDVEHKMSYYTAKQCDNGWEFDQEGKIELMKLIQDELTTIESTVEPLLGSITVMIDKEPKTPKYKKNGEYTAVSARVLSEYLGNYIDPSDALKVPPPILAGTEFQRSVLTPARIGNQDHLKEYLEREGIVWDDWNFKKVDGSFIKTSAKLTTTALTRMGPTGVMIDRFFTLRARLSVLTGWEKMYWNDRLHGDVIDIGAATGRQTHIGIANIPSPKAAYGSEIRKLFKVPEGKTIISADGASYQARIMAHFTKDKEFIKEITIGDIHQKNADAIGCSRAEAKPFFFAWAFGAGGRKLASILGIPESAGNKAKNKFLNRWPTLRDLTKRSQVAAQRGYLYGVDGRKIIVEESYKAFCYLIQGTEAIIFKHTIVDINEEFEAANIKFLQLLAYHDECSWEIDPVDAGQAEGIIRRCFEETPKKFGITLMCAGDVKCGKDYLEVH